MRLDLDFDMPDVEVTTLIQAIAPKGWMMGRVTSVAFEALLQQKKWTAGPKSVL